MQKNVEEENGESFLCKIKTFREQSKKLIIQESLVFICRSSYHKSLKVYITLHVRP